MFSEMFSDVDQSDVDQKVQPYLQGQDAFERGQYRAAIDYFQDALSVTGESSALGGAIQVWLVTAYEAAGRTEEALTLCRQLRTHGDYETRQQGKRLLYILEAPKLQLRPEWLTQIPELNESGSLSTYRASRDRAVGQVAQRTTNSASSKWRTEPMEPIDPKESSGFLRLALGVSVVMLGLWWLGNFWGISS
jgi:tetratricopeptide (TPR) repeat protein